MHNLNVFSVSYTYNRIHPCVMFLRHIPSARLCIVYKRETFTISMLEVLVQIRVELWWGGRRVLQVSSRLV